MFGLTSVAKGLWWYRKNSTGLCPATLKTDQQLTWSKNCSMDTRAQKSQQQSPVLLGVGLSLLLSSGNGITQTNSPGIDLFALEGWWRFDDPELAWGCNDTDNQYRVAIGRWGWNDATTEIDFGSVSEYRVGLYDSRCILNIEPVGGTTAVLQSKCVGEEGEEISGLTVIRVDDVDHIEVQLPLSSSMKLARCP